MESIFPISSTAWNLSFIENSFIVTGFRRVFKYDPIPLYGVFVVSTTGRKDGMFSNFLCVLGSPRALVINLLEWIMKILMLFQTQCVLISAPAD